MPSIAFDNLRVGINLPNAPQKGWAGSKDSNDHRGIGVFVIPGMAGSKFFLNVEITPDAARWRISRASLQTGFYLPQIVGPAEQAFFATDYEVKETEITRHGVERKVPGLRFRGILVERGHAPGEAQLSMMGSVRSTGKVLVTEPVATQRMWTVGPRFAIVNGIVTAELCERGNFVLAAHTHSPYYEMPGVLDVSDPKLLSFPPEADFDRHSQGATSALRSLIDDIELLF